MCRRDKQSKLGDLLIKQTVDQRLMRSKTRQRDDLFHFQARPVRGIQLINPRSTGRRESRTAVMFWDKAAAFQQDKVGSSSASHLLRAFLPPLRAIFHISSIMEIEY